ncbi:MAG TPA: STAS domain-containing protein [Candidatus Acidoferrales bacterium]|nr:STAS domain-containing protein [Candidatus Acidoferrales bacterium]
MKISARRVETTTILDVSGNIDMSNSTEVRKALLHEIRVQAVPRVILNLSGVNYIDSSGVASLVEGLKASRDLGSRLLLFGLNDAPRELFKISHLLKLFEVYDNETQAMASPARSA